MDCFGRLWEGVEGEERIVRKLREKEVIGE